MVLEVPSAIRRGMPLLAAAWRAPSKTRPRAGRCGFPAPERSVTYDHWVSIVLHNGSQGADSLGRKVVMFVSRKPSARHTRQTGVHKHGLRRSFGAFLTFAAVAIGVPALGFTAATFVDSQTSSASVGSIGTYDQRVKSLGPIGYWRMDEQDPGAPGNTEVLRDASGNNRDGVYREDSLLYSATLTGYTSGNGFRYDALSTAGTYTIIAGNALEYDMYVVPGSASMGVDFTTTTGVSLRDDVTAVDQNGVRAHPDLTNYPAGSWIHRRITIPDSFAGLVIGRVDLVSEANTGAAQKAYFADIRITANTGTTIKKNYFDGSTWPSITNALTSTNGTSSITSTGLGTAPSSQVQYGGGPGSVLFDGNANRAEIASPDLNLSTATAFTLEAWVKPTSALPSAARSSGPAFVCRSAPYSPGGGGEQYCLDYFDGRSRFFVRSGPSSADTSASGVALSAGQWHHLVGVYKAGTLSMYVDGTLAGSASGASNPLNTNPSGMVTRIGSRPGLQDIFNGPYGFAGSIDEVAVYPIALTAAQVQDHWVNH